MSTTAAASVPVVVTTTAPSATAPKPSKNDNIFANALNNIVKAITPTPDNDDVAKKSNDVNSPNNINPVDAVKEKITDAFGKFVEAITPEPDGTEVASSKDVTESSKPKQPEEIEEGEKNPFVNAFHKFVEVITPIPDHDVVRRGFGSSAKNGNNNIDDDAIIEGMGIPKYLNDALNVVTPSQRQLIITLYTEYGQEHLFQKKYFNSKSPPSMRRQLAQQLESLNREYVDGGLVGCIKNVRTLLNQSQNNVNPLDGWKPTLDTSAGKAFTLGTPEYQEMEAKGIPELGAVGFVLVAGGLGERLGYSGIKVRCNASIYTSLEFRTGTVSKLASLQSIF